MNLFQTTANTANNSFEDPLNPFNTTRGAWGIDPTYLTPSYAAPYRPQYQGPQGAPPPNRNVGFFNAAASAFTPFGESRMYGDTIRQDDPYYSAIGNRPVDNAMYGLQQYGAPGVGLIAGLAASSAKFASNNTMYTKTMLGYHYIFSKNAAEAGAKAAQMSAGARFGSSIGQGLARGVTGGLGATGINVGAGAARGFATASGFVGAGLGSLALPLIVGQGVQSIFEGTISDPYSAIRRNSIDMRENFSGIMAGRGSNGNGINGFGMSRQFSSKLATNLTRDSIKDMTFDTYGMGDLTDLASRSGQLDDVQLEKLEDRMKKLAKQVKVMMRVANEPDFRAAMEMMGELKVAGVSAGAAGRVLQNISGSSAIAGVSVQKMMNTVGAQGQYLYQSNNLTPYLGQTQAASTYAAFSSAYRMGLIGSNTMARFGGREGITQLAVTGQVNAAQTPYNQIMLMNENFGGGNRGSVVGNLAQFGQNASADPLGAAGAMGLYDSEMTSKQLMQKGPGAFLGQLNQIAQVIPGMRNKDGSIDVEKAFLIMTRQMNMPPMEVKAMLKQIQVYGDKGSREQMLSALHGDMQRDTIKSLEQEGMGAGSLNGFILPVRNLWKSVKEGGAGLVGDIAGVAGSVSDYIEKGVGGARFGSLVNGREASSFDEFEGGDSAKKYKLSGAGYLGGYLSLKTLSRFAGPVGGAQMAWKFWGDGSDLIKDNSRSIDSINTLVQAGDKDAMLVSDPNASPQERSAAVDRLNAHGKLDKKLSSSELKGFTDSILNGGTEEVENTNPITGADKIKKGINDSVGSDVDMLKGIGILEAARKVSTGQFDESSVKLLRDTYGKDMNLTELGEKATSVYTSAAKNGVAHLAGMLNGKSPEELEKAARAGDINEFGPGAKDLQKQIKEIDSSKLSPEGKRKKISDLITFARSKATDTGFASPIDPKILSEANIDPKAINNVLEKSRENSKQVLGINALAGQKVINFDTQYSSLAALELTKAVDTFGEFVGKLDKIADKFDGKSSTPSDGPEAPLFGLKNPFSKSTTTGTR